MSPGGALGEMDCSLATARGARAEHQAISESYETGKDEDFSCWGPRLSGQPAECGCDKPPLCIRLLQDRWGHRRSVSCRASAPQGSSLSAAGTSSGGGLVKEPFRNPQSEFGRVGLPSGGFASRGSWERLELDYQPLLIAQLERSSVCLLPDAPVGVTPPESPATWCW